MNIPHGISAQKFIDFVNEYFTHEESFTSGSLFTNVTEARRARILLAEVLLRLEKIEKRLEKK